MSNLIQDAKEQISSILNRACEKAVGKGELPAGAVLSGSVEIPKDTANGDYAANHAMTGARALHMAPRKIAEALTANMELEGTWFDSVEVAGPGFINFRLGKSWYGDVLRDIAAEGKDYGRVDVGHGAKCMVEFVSANPTGPMHMGNARVAQHPRPRGLQCLARVLRQRRRQPDREVRHLHRRALPPAHPRRG